MQTWPAGAGLGYQKVSTYFPGSISDGKSSLKLGSSGRVSEGEVWEDAFFGELLRPSELGSSRPEGLAALCNVAAEPRGNGS